MKLIKLKKDTFTYINPELISSAEQLNIFGKIIIRIYVDNKEYDLSNEEWANFQVLLYNSENDNRQQFFAG